MKEGHDPCVSPLQGGHFALQRKRWRKQMLGHLRNVISHICSLKLMWCFTMKDNRAVFSAWHGLGIWGLFQAAV